MEKFFKLLILYWGIYAQSLSQVKLFVTPWPITGSKASEPPAEKKNLTVPGGAGCQSV